jgi:hypothetical protein
VAVFIKILGNDSWKNRFEKKPAGSPKQSLWLLAYDLPASFTATFSAGDFNWHPDPNPQIFPLRNKYSIVIYKVDPRRKAPIGPVPYAAFSELDDLTVTVTNDNNPSDTDTDTADIDIVETVVLQRFLSYEQPSIPPESLFQLLAASLDTKLAATTTLKVENVTDAAGGKKWKKKPENDPADADVRVKVSGFKGTKARVDLAGVKFKWKPASKKLNVTPDAAGNLLIVFKSNPRSRGKGPLGGGLTETDTLTVTVTDEDSGQKDDLQVTVTVD